MGCGCRRWRGCGRWWRINEILPPEAVRAHSGVILSPFCQVVGNVRLPPATTHLVDKCMSLVVMMWVATRFETIMLPFPKNHLMMFGVDMVARLHLVARDFFLATTGSARPSHVHKTVAHCLESILWTVGVDVITRTCFQGPSIVILRPQEHPSESAFNDLSSMHFRTLELIRTVPLRFEMLDGTLVTVFLMLTTGMATSTATFFPATGAVNALSQQIGAIINVRWTHRSIVVESIDMDVGKTISVGKDQVLRSFRRKDHEVLHCCRQICAH